MKIRMLSLLFLGLALQTMPALAQERLPEYLQAEKFTRESCSLLQSTRIGSPREMIFGSNTKPAKALLGMWSTPTHAGRLRFSTVTN